MPTTVLYTEKSYADDSVERRIYGPDVRVIFPKEPTTGLADLPDEDCAAAEGLMILIRVQPAFYYLLVVTRQLRTVEASGCTQHAPRI